MENDRGSWGSTFGFIMAAVGSAVGLGNIWGFPYKMGKSGGFAFLLIYLALAVFVGMIIMCSELALGRKTGKGVIAAYQAATKKFAWLGWLGVIAPFLIMSFYSVLGGYCIQYMSLNMAELSFNLSDIFGAPLAGGATFGAMLDNPFGCAVFTALFLFICMMIVKGGVAEGIVYSSKPLSYQGQLIDRFWIRFREGKAAEWGAEENEALLTKLITMDEGSAYLGECALVPFNSPINETGILFYNTLFDENACCHLALGMGFADTIRDFEHKTLDECRALGVNDSMIHEDFMIGTADLSIDALCEDGRTVPLFRNGTWAF